MWQPCLLSTVLLEGRVPAKPRGAAQGHGVLPRNGSLKKSANAIKSFLTGHWGRMKVVCLSLDHRGEPACSAGKGINLLENTMASPDRICSHSPEIFTDISIEYRKVRTKLILETDPALPEEGTTINTKSDQVILVDQKLICLDMIIIMPNCLSMDLQVSGLAFRNPNISTFYNGYFRAK